MLASEYMNNFLFCEVPITLSRLYKDSAGDNSYLPISLVPRYPTLLPANNVDSLVRSPSATLNPRSVQGQNTTFPATVEGRSFARILSGEKDEVYGEVFCHFRDKQRMIRADRWKLIHYPHIDRWQLFDLKDDPHEGQDLAGDTAYADVVARLKAKLMSWQQQVGDPLLKQ